MSEVGAVTACVESTGVGRSRLIYQEIVYLRNEETACEQPLEEMASRLVAYTGEITVVVSIMRPQALVHRVVLAVPVVHHTEAIAERQHPGAMGIIELGIEVGHQVLFAPLADIPSVLVVHLSTDYQPEVGREEGGIEFDKGVGIAVTLLGVTGRTGVVAADLGKEQGIVLESMRVRQHEASVPIIKRKSFGQARAE